MFPSQHAAKPGLFHRGEGAEGDHCPHQPGAPQCDGWAEQGLPTAPTDSPTQGKGSIHPSRDGPAGVRGRERSGNNTVMLVRRQDTSRVSLRSIQEMGTETALETKSKYSSWITGQKVCGWWLGTATKYWCPQGPDMGREVSALKSLQSNEKYGWHWEKQQDNLASTFPILCSLWQMRAVKEHRLQEGCSSLCLTPQL